MPHSPTTPNAERRTPNEPPRKFATLLLTALLLLLALRLTMTESLYDNYQQVSAQYAARLHPPGGILAPEIGPAVTLGLAAASTLLVAATAALATAAGTLSLKRLLRFLLIAVILAFGINSTLHAANRFVALVGLADIGMSLLAGWAVSLLCHQKLLGNSARRIIIAALLSLLTVWTAKGLYQRAIEIPDTIDYYNHHKEEALAAQEMRVDDPGIKLYESRMNSKEVTGYVTLSNVMGAGMIGLLAALAGLLAAQIVGTHPPAEPEKPQRQKSKNEPAEISTTTLFLTLSITLLLLGILTTFLTQSRGGSILSVLCALVLFAGGYFWQKAVVHRRMLIFAALLFWGLATAAILGFGITHDRLPVKSLLFRWHYWTAAAPLIQNSPTTGVGLNNFGNYYPSVKRASSPESVRDPHSFFVRLAAEMGIPATLAIAALILWLSLAATRPVTETEPALSPAQLLRLQLLGIFFALLWWILHQLLAETSEPYSLILSGLSALIAAGSWYIAAGLLDRLNARGLRATTFALLIGALGMLAYDQINMALVTGPVAMLFWMMLGAADSYDVPTPVAAPAKFLSALIAFSMLCAAIALTFLAWIPTLNNSMPWDSRPFIDSSLAAASTDNFPAAKSALTEAITRDPRSIALRRQMILLKEELHEPIDEEIQKILTLDRTDFRLRKSLALETPSLAPAERIQLLTDALRLNAQLPPDEIMRLSPEENAKIQSALTQLQPATTQK